MQQARVPPVNRLAALAIHVCADNASAGPGRRWPVLHATHDTARRVHRICRLIGVDEQCVLAGDQATVAGLVGALEAAAAELLDDGLLVLTFSGHTLRGTGPVETARWCLFDGGVQLSQIAGLLARLAGGIRVIIVCDTCYALAIASVLCGPQPVVVVAGCGEDQTMLDRTSSEFVVRLEAFLERNARGSLARLRGVLEADTPDCERPMVWTNVEQRWSEAIAGPASRSDTE